MVSNARLCGSEKEPSYLWLMATHPYIQLDSLPEDVRKKVLVLIEDLMKQWEHTHQKAKSSKSGMPGKRVFGIAKGMATISKDFDAPLDDFKEYME